MHDQSSPGHAHGAEEWRAVVGFEGRYEVSNQGRVRSLRLRGTTPRGGGYDRLRAEPLVLRPDRPRGGYLGVRLTGHQYRLVHRAVLEAFVGPCPNGQEGAHNNGVRDDNRLENLTWKTPKKNAQDKYRHGTMATGDRSGSRLHPERVPRGERARSARLTAAQVIEIRAAQGGADLERVTAARYGVTQATISKVLLRRTWRHL